MRKILVVDDEPDILWAIKSSLERQKDLKVSVARDGEEALKSLEAEIPDLVLLDLTMPKLSGEQVLRIIRRDSRFLEIPVIISTVRRETASLINLMNIGATDYLMKPYDIPELLKVINTYT